MKEKILHDYITNENLSLSDIAKKHNTTRQNVSRIVIANGYEPNARFHKQLAEHKDNQKQIVINMLTVETVADDIKVIFDRDRNFISALFRHIGISLYDISTFRRLYSNYQIKFLQNIPNLPRSSEKEIEEIIELAKEKINVDIDDSTIHAKLIKNMQSSSDMVVSFKNMADVLGISVSYVQKNISWLEDFMANLLPNNEKATNNEILPIYDTVYNITEEYINSLSYVEKIIQLAVFNYKMLETYTDKTQNTPLSFEYEQETYTIDKPIGEYIVSVLSKV